MEIWLRRDKKNYYQFAVLPASIEVSNSMQNTTVNLTNLGEVNLIGKSGLITISLSSFFPNRVYDFVQYEDFPKPMECVNMILSWMDDPIHVKITRTLDKVMTIESFTYSRQDATGDIYFTIELKEYKRPTSEAKSKTKLSKTTKKIVKPVTSRESKKVKSQTYTVKKGDTLSTIAKRLTGDSGNYKAIANQNKITNPNRISVGMKLVIKV